MLPSNVFGRKELDLVFATGSKAVFFNLWNITELLAEPKRSY